jgi:N-acetylglutamate synthase-like GNAT family acetyltransferase
MYVRGAKNREEVWLLDRLEEFGLADPAFRSRDYVVALDERTGEKAGFGRVRFHAGDPAVCEMAAVGVLEEYRGQGVGAHVIERLLERARDEGFERVFALTESGGYLGQFGFRAIAEGDLPPVLAERLEEVRATEKPEAVPMVIDADTFEMPSELRRRFKRAGEDETEADAEPEERPEDFGIDPDAATYKYDTGRR